MVTAATAPGMPVCYRCRYAAIRYGIVTSLPVISCCRRRHIADTIAAIIYAAALSRAEDTMTLVGDDIRPPRQPAVVIEAYHSSTATP